MTSWFRIAFTSLHVFPCPMSNMTMPSWIDQNYACATRSSLPADRFHTKVSVRFAFTWYPCVSSYWSEILAPVQQPGWTQAGVDSRWHDILCWWSFAGAKVAPVSSKHPPYKLNFFFCAFLVTYSERLKTLEDLRKTQLKIGKIPATSKCYVKSDTDYNLMRGFNFLQYLSSRLQSRGSSRFVDISPEGTSEPSPLCK